MDAAVKLRGFALAASRRETTSERPCLASGQGRTSDYILFFWGAVGLLQSSWYQRTLVVPSWAV